MRHMASVHLTEPDLQLQIIPAASKCSSESFYKLIAEIIIRSCGFNGFGRKVCRGRNVMNGTASRTRYNPGLSGFSETSKNLLKTQILWWTVLMFSPSAGQDSVNTEHHLQKDDN